MDERDEIMEAMEKASWSERIRLDEKKSLVEGEIVELLEDELRRLAK